MLCYSNQCYRLRGFFCFLHSSIRRKPLDNNDNNITVCTKSSSPFSMTCYLPETIKFFFLGNDWKRIRIFFCIRKNILFKLVFYVFVVVTFTFRDFTCLLIFFFLNIPFCRYNIRCFKNVFNFLHLSTISVIEN